MSQDILFKTDDYIFSYRVAGILIKNGNILLQKPLKDKGYSIPGGHVAFGELSSETLIREFKEEINADVKIERLIMVGENFWPWGNRPCQQISFYYEISLCDENQIPLEGTFPAYDDFGNKRIDLEFSWIDLHEIKNLVVYPSNIKEELLSLPKELKYFVYRQE
jgi:ADP-ribose pyrophosphatase YjhB (NUDIX family)